MSGRLAELDVKRVASGLPVVSHSENRENNDTFSRAHYFAHGAFVHDRDVSLRDGTHQTVVLPNR